MEIHFMQTSAYQPPSRHYPIYSIHTTDLLCLPKPTAALAHVVCLLGQKEYSLLLLNSTKQ